MLSSVQSLLYFGHSLKCHQAYPSPPATLSISYFALCSRSFPSVDHLLERADSHTPCQVLTQCTHASPPACLTFLGPEGVGEGGIFAPGCSLLSTLSNQHSHVAGILQSLQEEGRTERQNP